MYYPLIHNNYYISSYDIICNCKLFDLDALTLGPITIPKLPTVRFKEITAVGSGVNSNIFGNFINNIKMLFTNDGNILNYTKPYGLFLCNWITIPITIIGIVVSIYKQISFLNQK